MEVKLATSMEKRWIENFLLENWGADFVLSRGQKHYPAQHEALIAEESGQRLGLLTFRQEGDAMEVLTLDSLIPNQGTGSMLLDQLRSLAAHRKVARIWLITTNDNLDALRFYQRKGFDLCALHRNEVAKARQHKPSIPLRGSFGIPIRHEIELELSIR